LAGDAIVGDARRHLRHGGIAPVIWIGPRRARAGEGRDEQQADENRSADNAGADQVG
jgi:hypothetical protein